MERRKRRRPRPATATGQLARPLRLDPMRIPDGILEHDAGIALIEIRAGWLTDVHEAACFQAWTRFEGNDKVVFGDGSRLERAGDAEIWRVCDSDGRVLATG